MLPQTTASYDQIWAAPDGTAVVVALTINQGGASRNFYVSKSITKKVSGTVSLLEATSSRASLAASIKTAFSPAEDIALVGSMGTLGATLVGTTQYPATLKKLIPEVVQA